MKRPLFLCVIIVFSTWQLITASEANQPLSGDWVGTAKTTTEQTGFVLHIDTNGSVSVSLPDIGVSKWPAVDVTISRDGIKLNLPSDSGKQAIRLSLKGDQLKGTWKDHPKKTAPKLTLRR